MTVVKPGSPGPRGRSNQRRRAVGRLGVGPTARIACITLLSERARSLVL